MLDEGDLTAAEADVVDAIGRGIRAACGGKSIRASVIRALATRSKPDWQIPFSGISIDDATIEGCLDLEGCTLESPLVFLRCRFTPAPNERSAILLRDARLKRIALYECAVEGAIKADRVHIETAFFLTTTTVSGLVRLRGASIGEALAMDASRIENPSDIAILADGMRLGGPWIMRSCSVAGETRLAGARIEGGLLWEEVQLTSSKVALNADGAVAESAWILRRARISGSFRARGLQARAIDAANLDATANGEALNLRGAELKSDLFLENARIRGGLLLGHATLGGELTLRGAEISGPGTDWAIAAGGLEVRQSIVMAGARLNGGLSLAGARINLGLQANDLSIKSAGRAIEADVIALGGNWIMRSANIQGSIRLAGAKIEGQLALTACTIEGGGDLAIRADGATIRGGWFMGRAEIRGLVRLPAAQLGNEMRLRGTTIKVSGGPALFANGVRIARELVLDNGFTTVGAVALDHAHIDGTIDLTGSHITSAKLARNDTPIERNYDEILDARYDEAAISLVDARADRLVMPNTAPDRPRGIIDLSRAHVGSYEDHAAAWPPVVRDKSNARGRTRDGRDIDHLILDGFVYEHLEIPDGTAGSAGEMAGTGAARMRTRWLDAQCELDLKQHFKPQAWMQLGKRLSAQGYQDEAREIAIARRRRQRKSATTGWLARMQGWILDVFALYGFAPWRTITWMVVFVALFSGLWAIAAADCGRNDCKDEQVFTMALKGDFGQDETKAVANYPPFNPLAYSFDVFVPFVDFGFEGHWRPNVSYGQLMRVDLAPLGLASQITVTKGSLLYLASILETLIGLVLTSLAVTGFTGILSNEDDLR